MKEQKYRISLTEYQIEGLINLLIDTADVSYIPLINQFNLIKHKISTSKKQPDFVVSGAQKASSVTNLSPEEQAEVFRAEEIRLLAELNIDRV